MNTLATEGVGEWDKYTKAVNKSGSANKVLKNQTAGAAGSIEQLQSSADTFAITLGERLAPALVPLLQSLTKIINILTKYPKVTTAVFGALFIARQPRSGRSTRPTTPTRT